MLQRIEVHVIDVPLEVGVVADGMLPVATLPDSLLAFRRLAG
jgi:hypothetical protein